MQSPFRYFNSSPEIIRLAVMMYVRFPLSLRQVEDLLSERGIDICNETVRYWWNRFGPPLIGNIQARVAVMFNLWAKHMIGRGREHDLHAELARIVGEDQPAIVMASIRRNTTKRPRTRAADTVQPDLFS